MRKKGYKITKKTVIKTGKNKKKTNVMYPKLKNQLTRSVLFCLETNIFSIFLIKNFFNVFLVLNN